MELPQELLDYNPIRHFADEITLPNNALDMFEKKIGPRIILFPDTKQILKIGHGIARSEADAMRLLATQTSVPVARVDRVGERGDSGYILMSQLEGQPLADVWSHLGWEARASLAQELRGYIQEWRALRGEYYGALGEQLCQDIFFKHLPVYEKSEINYGPYRTRSEYNAGIRRALQMSRPFGIFDERDEALLSKVGTLEDTAIVFTHGDLHLDNILVKDGKISGILDWGASGYSIKDREYYEARSRARDLEWKAVLESVFAGEIDMTTYLILEQLDKELVVYSGF
ncbi:kinase-like protein [Dothidotthia symphoricarpi CBS 119687]|uniref:Kinase-like protein n=1 Tax=Dothidotthia symphoricarpi CBS 119687 TaxID=1392245 RepID=A0A6A6AL60_9PLEO|nr:kinase-like protein [Dothidotthia symphoricarpi CBS 119687]KAF2131825.1 kinase-like protein [Dothidotthia symphoricarpi CBS 119687]